MNTIVHAIEGRVRVKVEKVKRDRRAAQSLERSLRTIEGVKKVKANPTTRSVVLYYDQWRVSQRELTDLLGAPAFQCARGQSEDGASHQAPIRQMCLES